MTRTTSATDLATSWARLRTDSPTLAETLVTEEFRYWSDSVPDSDAVVGARDLARFVTDEQERTGTRITTRIIAGDADRIAFTWDASPVDGTVRTGIDVARLAPDGKIASSWSITGARPHTLTN